MEIRMALRAACFTVAVVGATRVAVAQPSSDREAWVEGRFDAVARSGTTGGRVSVTRLAGSDADDTGHGLALTFAGHSERYGAFRSFNVREASFAFIGGGSLGF